MTYEQSRQDAHRAKKADEFFARFDKLMMKLGCYVDDDSRKIDHFFIESLCEQDLIVGPLEFEYETFAQPQVSKRLTNVFQVH